MEGHQKQYYLTIAAVLLGYFVTRLYDNVYAYFYPELQLEVKILTSFVMVVLIATIMYFILYHGKKGFLRLRHP
jgi:hypothetical protein